MAVFWLYVALILGIAFIEVYKFKSKKQEEDVLLESWVDYHVRVHSRVPKYRGPNPFERDDASFYEQLKRLLMTPVALLRVVLFVLLVIAGAIVSYPAAQFKFQRKATSRSLRFFVRVILFLFGFYTIPCKRAKDSSAAADSGGRRLVRKQPRVIVGNHHTVFDGLILLALTDGVIACTEELRRVPFFGNCLVALDAIFIDRHGKDGRNKAKQQLMDHILNENLPPLIIFPQGTTCSIKTLTTFKPGAFLVKTEVQPVILNYSANQNHDMSYVGASGMLQEMFWAGCQLVNFCELVFLSPFLPANEEHRDPHTFAEHTRQQMGQYMTAYCQLTPHSLTDHMLHDYAITRSKFNLKMEFLVGDVGETLRLKPKTVQYLAKKFHNLDTNQNGYITFSEFCAAFKRDPSKHFGKMSKLFQLFSVNNNFNKIDFDEFLNGVAICFVDSMVNDAIRVTFDGCSVDNRVIRSADILNVFNHQIEKKKFNDENEFVAYYDKMQFFVDSVFDNNQMQQMDYNQFYQHIIERDLTAYVQLFLQIIIMMRLKIKLHKDDFNLKVQSHSNAEIIKDDNGGDDDDGLGAIKDSDVSVQQHPRTLRSDSILSVGQTNFAKIENKL